MPESGSESQLEPERDKVRHHGIGDESRARAVYARLESNSEPERARVCQRVAVRASESQNGSHREPGRDPVRARVIHLGGLLREKRLASHL